MTPRKQTTPYPLRLPEDLRAYLEDQAAAGHRSLHAEIVMRLEQTRQDHIGKNKGGHDHG